MTNTFHLLATVAVAAVAGPVLAQQATSAIVWEPHT